ncbi:MAG: hypothetical protein LBS31_03645 [Candidatus Adiutrix sp.]|jgi:hypothetical protein|nr:hypothetical protein [Candidatus Adiutrix sp.]
MMPKALASPEKSVDKVLIMLLYYMKGRCGMSKNHEELTKIMVHQVKAYFRGYGKEEEGGLTGQPSSPLQEEEKSGLLAAVGEI